MTENDKPAEAEQPVEEEQPAKVRVPTRRDAYGEAEYVDSDPDAAWQWDARRWERLR